VLRLEGLTYRHAGAPLPSLNGIDLTIGDGEVVGVVGANGAGKTTLCLVLSGLAPRVIGGKLGGRFLIDEVDVTASNDGRSQRDEPAADQPAIDIGSQVGITFDDPASQLSGVAGTVFEEVAFGPSNFGVPRDELVDRTWDALATLGIGDLAERDPSRLSGGQQQMVAMASILALRPRHIVLDEPTAQLDPAGTALVGEAIGKLAASGVAVVVVEHKTDLLAAAARRVLVLDAGRIVLDGPADEILADPSLPEHGVAEPSAIRLRRRMAEAGLDPGRLAAALDVAVRR
jgi:energy-coupling factor transporter ATP-binding protein EcfA2